MPSPKRATMAWATASGGNLTARERRRMIQTVLGQLAPLTVDRLAADLGRRPSGRATVLDAVLTPPDTPWATAAEAVAAQQADVVTGHALRTYAYGAVLAARDGVELDLEVFYPCALLHDLTLEQAPREECFTLSSAEAVRKAALDVGVDADVAEAAADAIVAHFEPGITVEGHGPIAMYIQQGAMLDLTGQRRSDVSAETIRAVTAAHPVGDTHAAIAGYLVAATRSAPRTRPAVMRRCGLPEMIRLAPAEMKGA